MKSPNNGENRILSAHLLSPNKASNTRIGLHLIEFLSKRMSNKSSNNLGYYQPRLWVIFYKLTKRSYS